MNCAMKERKKQNSVVIEVGDILLARVSIYFILWSELRDYNQSFTCTAEFGYLEHCYNHNVFHKYVSIELKVPTTFCFNFKSYLESLNI